MISPIERAVKMTCPHKDKCDGRYPCDFFSHCFQRTLTIQNLHAAGMLAQGWRPIEEAPRDGTPIEYFHEKWKIPSLCEWQEPEGYDPHWWDESMTETAHPKWWRTWTPPS